MEEQSIRLPHEIIVDDLRYEHDYGVYEIAGAHIKQQEGIFACDLLHNP